MDIDKINQKLKEQWDEQKAKENKYDGKFKEDKYVDQEGQEWNVGDNGLRWRMDENGNGYTLELQNLKNILREKNLYKIWEKQKPNPDMGDKFGLEYGTELLQKNGIYLNKDYNLDVEKTKANFSDFIKNLQLKVLQTMQNDKRTATEMLVQFILCHNHIYTTRDDEKSEVWIYREGVYQSEGKTYINEICGEILGKAHTKHTTNEVINKIQARTYIDADIFFNQNEKHLVCLKNGIYDLQKKKLVEHTPEKIFFQKLPVVYDQDADCPNIDTHFKTVLKDESDANVMYEICGWMLYREYTPEKAVMFLGDGRNGKSKTLKLFKEFLGVDNCCDVPLTDLEDNNFAAATLHGKLANLSGDLPSRSLKNTAMFKKLVGKDTITADRKYKKPITFENYAKMLFACNQLPRTYDVTRGFFSKWLMFEFPFTFVDKNVYEDMEKKEGYKVKDPHIINELVTDSELSGLFNKAIEGLQRVLSLGRFSYSKGTEEVKQMWIRRSDSFLAFCMECLEEDRNSKIEKSDLRSIYSGYCRVHNERPVGNKGIKNTLEHEYVISEGRDVDRGMYWQGIKWKKPAKRYVGIISESRVNKGFKGFSDSVMLGKMNKSPNPLDTLELPCKLDETILGKLSSLCRESTDNLITYYELKSCLNGVVTDDKLTEKLAEYKEKGWIIQPKAGENSYTIAE